MYPQNLPPTLISRDWKRPAGDQRNRTRPFVLLNLQQSHFTSFLEEKLPRKLDKQQLSRILFIKFSLNMHNVTIFYKNYGILERMHFENKKTEQKDYSRDQIRIKINIWSHQPVLYAYLFIIMKIVKDIILGVFERSLSRSFERCKEMYKIFTKISFPSLRSFVSF